MMRSRYMELYEANELLGAMILGRKVIEVSRGMRLNKTVIFADDLYNVAQIYEELGDDVSAKELYSESVALIGENCGKNTKYIQHINNAGAVCARLSDYELAEACFTEGISLIDKFNPKDLSAEYELWAMLNLNMAFMLMDTERVDKSIVFFMKVFGSLRLENQYTKIRYLCTHGFARCNAARKSAMAKSLYKEAIDLAEEIYLADKTEDNCIEIVDVSMDACEELLKDMEWEEALMLYAPLPGYVEESISRKHPIYAEILNRMADCYINEGKIEQALDARSKALELLVEVFGENHLYVSNNMRFIALCQLMIYDEYMKSEAYEMMEKALLIKKNLVGAASDEYTNDITLAAGIFISQGEYDKSLLLVADTIKILRRLPETHDFINRLTKIRLHIRKLKDKYGIKDSTETNHSNFSGYEIYAKNFIATIEGKKFGKGSESDEGNDTDTDYVFGDKALMKLLSILKEKL